MPVTLRSYSKINLGLAIGPTRPDGFHALTTLYQTIEAHDLLTLSVEAASHPQDGSAIELSSNDRRLPLDARNTVWKILAAALAVPGREQLHDRLRVKVHIEKRLPVQGGLGGGSANAATALVGFERELARRGLASPLAGDEQLRLAAEVGSDVPLFLLGGTVLGLERGEQVVPLPDLCSPGRELVAVIALPDIGVSTPAAFRAWDQEQAALGLTPEAMAGRLVKLSRALASAWTGQHASGVLTPRQIPYGSWIGENLAGPLFSLVQTGIFLNDFEQVVFRQHPLLETIKRALASDTGTLDQEALYVALSGSGSAVFGLYAVDGAARAAETRLDELKIRHLRTRILGRAAYWASMVADKM